MGSSTDYRSYIECSTGQVVRVMMIVSKETVTMTDSQDPWHRTNGELLNFNSFPVALYCMLYQNTCTTNGANNLCSPSIPCVIPIMANVEHESMLILPTSFAARMFSPE